MKRIVLPVAGLLLPFLMGCCCDGTCRRSACTSHACNAWYAYTPGCPTGMPNYADIPQVPAESVVRAPVVTPRSDDLPPEAAPDIAADIPVPDESNVPARDESNTPVPVESNLPADAELGDDVPGPVEVAPADGEPTTK